MESVVHISKDVVSCRLGDEVAALHLRHGVYYGLAAVGVDIWNWMQESQSVALKDIRDHVLDEYDVSSPQCEEDLVRLVDQLRSKDLVQVIEY